MRKIHYIVVHCTATLPHQDIGVKEIDRMHRRRGWSKCGYHLVIKQDGTEEVGRPLSEIGAHVKGFNRNSIGIVYVGGLNADGKPQDTRTEAQKKALRFRLMALKQLFPDAKIVGHRDLSPDKNGNGIIERHEWLKACPCFDAYEEYKDIWI